jgi:SAM-dependent methyltransferase
LIGVIILLLLLTLSREFAKAGTLKVSYFQTLGGLLREGRDLVNHVATTLAFTYINIIKRTKTHLKISDIVLDYGCGTGLISNEIAEYVKGIHAIDISSNMIGIAEKRQKSETLQI